MLIKRLQEFIEYQGLNHFAFEKSVGLSNCALRKKLDSGLGNLKTDTLKAILEKYPELSADWLILGTGSMLRYNNKEESQSKDKDTQASNLNDALQIINKQQDTIKELTKAVTILIENTNK